MAAKPHQIILKRKYDLGLKIFDLANLWMIGFFFRDLIYPNLTGNILALWFGLSVFAMLYAFAWWVMRGGEGS